MEWQHTHKAIFQYKQSIDVWFLSLDQAVVHNLNFLDASQQSFLTSLKSHKAADRFISTRYWIHHLLSEYLGSDDLTFSQSGNGKPFLSSPDNQLDFNLTHSGNIALLAVSNFGPVGIDIEILREIKNVKLMAKRVFDQTDYLDLSETNEADLSSHFLNLWTKMEAQQKLSGNGIFGKKALGGETETLSFQANPKSIATLAWQNAKLKPQIQFLKYVME